MNRNSTLQLAAALLLLFVSSSVFAQAAQTYHAAGLKLDDGAGHTVTLLPPATGSGASFPFPSNAPSSGDVITSNGSGGVSWAAPAAFTPAYLNAYTTSSLATIPPGGVISLNTISDNSGFAATGPGVFTVITPGKYMVEWTVARIESSSFGILVNGVMAPNTQFGCATGTSVLHASAILTLTAGQTISLAASPANSSAVTLEFDQIGTSVGASITAMRFQ